MKIKENLRKPTCAANTQICDVFLSHNDAHMMNMMMDRNDTTAESLILIDFDNTQYGYRYTINYYFQ